MTSRRLAPGFTLLELLVVLALIGMLAALVLAAIQKIRGVADRAQCRDRLRQVGLALHHYHDSMGSLPQGASGERSSEPQPFLSCCARLLPYLEQEALWRDIEAAFRIDRNFLNDPPHTALRTPLRQFGCPTDVRVRTAQALNRRGRMRAFTSYLGVNGTNAALQDGVLFLDSRVRLVEITDGTSNTLAVGERPPSANLVFGWWYAGWGQDKDGEADMVLGARTRSNGNWAKGCPSGPYHYQRGDYKDQCDAFHFWSPHPGGAHFLYADGSVHFTSYTADPVLPALATRAGGEPAELP